MKVHECAAFSWTEIDHASKVPCKKCSFEMNCHMQPGLVRARTVNGEALVSTDLLQCKRFSQGLCSKGMI